MSPTDHLDKLSANTGLTDDAGPSNYNIQVAGTWLDDCKYKYMAIGIDRGVWLNI